MNKPLLRTNLRARIYVFLTAKDLVLKVAKLSRFERRLLPKVAARYTKHIRTSLDQFNVVVPPAILQSEKAEKKTRMNADMGLTYIIKTFRSIHLHLRKDSALDNLAILAKIISSREKSCKISLSMLMTTE